MWLLNYIFCSFFVFTNTPGITNVDTNLMQIANKGYFYAKQHKITDSPIMMIVDYSKVSTEKRLWLVNMQNKEVILNSYVAHGKNSGLNKAKYFSNKIASKKSSLGFFITKGHYFGHHGESIRLLGLESNINDNAFKRAIVIHSSKYTSESTINSLHRLGRSYGCFALNNHDLSVILQKTQKKPMLVLSYYPQKSWLSSSKFLA